MQLTARKYAGETEFFSFDWTARIGTDTISSSTWTADAALIITSQSIPTTKTTQVKIGGGIAGTQYTVVNVIILSVSGSVLEAKLQLLVD